MGDTAAEAEQFTPDGPVVLVLGAPGSGKDTQCDRLVQKLGGCHLSTVDLVREAVESKTTQGTKISNMIRAGQIPTAQVYLDLLKDAMRQRKGPYLIQGFPKAIDHLRDFEAQCGSCSGAIFLRAGEETLTQRLLERGKTSIGPTIRRRRSRVDSAPFSSSASQWLSSSRCADSSATSTPHRAPTKSLRTLAQPMGASSK